MFREEPTLPYQMFGLWTDGESEAPHLLRQDGGAPPTGPDLLSEDLA